MIKPRQTLRKNGTAKRLPRVPDGERYYVIGDVHGRCDLLDALIEAIEADDAARGSPIRRWSSSATWSTGVRKARG